MQNYLSDYEIVKKNCLGKFSNYQVHKNSTDYMGCEYYWNDEKIIQRTAKQTLKKLGQFVTLWKRDSEGNSIPYEASDDFIKLIVLVFSGKKKGRFLFTKEDLIKQSILTSNKEGKRGFRLYPPWDEPTSRQAITTQNWQLDFFEEEISLE